MLPQLLERLLPSRGQAPPVAARAADPLYVTRAPHPQNAVDIFKGEWSSALPARAEATTGAAAALFEDARITWFAEVAGGVRGKAILELGPLEGGHTSMLESLGAQSILAIEANTRAFLRCLLVKDLLGLERARFVCGDFLEYLRGRPATFELVVASGVLYHMEDPAELVDLLSRVCTERVFVWTHYYDPALVAKNPGLERSFVGSREAVHAGFAHRLHRQIYQVPHAQKGFCAAGTAGSHWLSRADLFACFEHFGLAVEAVHFDHPDHPNGPALAFVAKRATA